MKKLFSLLIILAFIICIFPFSNNANADGLTLTSIAALSYAIGQYSGLSFNFTDGSANGVKNAMEGYINNWLAGRTIGEAFGSELARIEAGKLIVPAVLFNNIRDFLNDIISDNDLETGDEIIFPGEIDGVIINNLNQNWEISSEGFSSTVTVGGSRFVFTLYYNGRVVPGGGYTYTGSNKATDGQAHGWAISGYSDNTVTVVYSFSVYRIDTEERKYYAHATSGTVNNLQVENIGSASISEGYSPTVLNPSQDWASSSYVGPDTNLDQLIGTIFEEVADNNLDIDGEVIDPPAPTPTPVPIDPDTPLSDVPWEGLDTNLQELYNQGLEEIGAIGDAQDAITDAVADQTGVLEDALADNAGVVSGAIGQAVSDIQDSISEQTDALSESASATAEAAESIAEALEDETINWQKFDLRGLFPFCIPFDIYNMLEALDASPTAPHVQLPFVIDSINFSYTIDLDFSAFDQVAAVMRQMELIAYAIALAWGTSKVIKW